MDLLLGDTRLYGYAHGTPDFTSVRGSRIGVPPWPYNRDQAWALPISHQGKGLLCVHLSRSTNLCGKKHDRFASTGGASEMTNIYFLECTKDNIEQSKNRFWCRAQGAILVIELKRDEREQSRYDAKVGKRRCGGVGGSFSLLFGEDSKTDLGIRREGGVWVASNRRAHERRCR